MPLETTDHGVSIVLARLEPTLERVDDRTRKMEANLASVDGRLRTIETETLPGIEADLAELKGLVSGLPGFSQLVGLVVAAASLAGIMGLLFRFIHDTALLP